MPPTRTQKEEVLKNLIPDFEKAKSIIFTKFEGLSVKDMTDLRSKLRKSNVKYKIAKKTLLRKAAKQVGLPEIPREITEGPVSTAFSFGDEVIAAKILYTFAKEHEALKLLGGIMNGELLSKEKTLQLAKLPTKEELLTKLVGSLNAPIYGFYAILSGVLKGFMYALNGVKEQKSKV